MKYVLNITVIIILCLLTGTIQAQVINIVPTTEGNNRDFAEGLGINRPGLSITGFDNGGNNQYGLGLKQILNEAYAGSNGTKDLLLDILEISTTSDVFLDPVNNTEIETNSNVIQYKAFEALASYVLEENGIDSVTSNDVYNIPIRSHATVIDELKEVFEHHYSVSDYTPNSFPLVTNRSDYVKNVNSYGNIARFLDLYLALENAYKEWDFYSW